MKHSRLIRKAEVLHMTGLSHSTLYFFMKNGTFPQNVKLGKRSVAWKEDEVFEWLDNRK